MEDFIEKLSGIEELNELTESPKNTLTMLWKPEKYDIVVVQVCIDVENGIYDYEFMKRFFEDVILIRVHCFEI